MPAFISIIQKFTSKGEKTGWTYIDVPPDVLAKFKRKDKKEFRVKGVIDDVKVERLATYPVGKGNFIIALNGDLRKKLGKKEGATVSVKVEVDNAAPLQSEELMDCLAQDPAALKQFNTLPLSHRNYFHRYIYSAKGADTRAGRIVNVMNAMNKKQNFGEMMRALKGKWP